MPFELEVPLRHSVLDHSVSSFQYFLCVLSHVAGVQCCRVMIWLRSAGKSQNGVNVRKRSAESRLGWWRSNAQHCAVLD